MFYLITTKLDIVTNGEAHASPKNHKLKKHRILFHKGDACPSTPTASLKKNSDFSRRVRYVPHPKNTNSKT